LITYQGLEEKNNIVINKNEISLPDSLQKSLNNEQFLLFDSNGFKQDRILVFYTYTNLVHLENCTMWVCDVTFFSCPYEFSQLYAIQGLIREISIR
jgi:hypothetical protein